ncbi:MAG: acyltransferase, partial [Succinivibrio sp.]|nr:acyltransferase [Succinivibrio sp.]
MFFHAFPFYMKGGFVGVDIFFVISGYLISSILYRNLYNSDNPGHVNIVDFYIRRVRRIFPALIAVLVFLLAVGWVILLPDEYQRLGKHVLGGSTYISNFMLYYESGDYFNVESNLKPLLHLWSLGVEEQFYLIFPIFLWVLYKLKLSFIKSLTVFTAISFALNMYFILKGNGSYSFY